jgi:hypothetical protein
MRTVVHVNQHVIRRNRKEGANEPVITVKQGRKNTYAHGFPEQAKGPQSTSKDVR